MKLSAILMLAGCLQVSAITYSQGIYLSVRDVPLQTVFEDIERQTDYHFFYKVSLVPKFQNVNVQFQNASIEDAMQELFKWQPLNFKIVNKTIVVTEKKKIIKSGGMRNVAALPVLAISVSGTVTDEQQNPLVGASILIKGTSRGTFTDEKGFFSLTEVTDEDILVISYVGFMNQEVSVSGRTVINISMQPLESQLDEIVVVGFGTQKKINLTGSVDQVSSKQLTDRPVTTLSQALQGVVANVNVTTSTGGGTPGASPSINIRGYTGLGVSGSPLILVDGVESDINVVNPNDVESISVLKDAASAAIYGSRGPHGVILITTKQGKKGEGIKISYNSYVSFSQTINRPTPVNSLQFATIFNEAAQNAGRAPLYSDEEIVKIKAHLADPSAPSTEADKRPGREHLWNGYLDAYANTDWYDEFTRDWSTNQRHHLSLNGGSEKTSFYVGLGFTETGAISEYFDDSYDQYNFRANLTTEVTPWLKVGLRTSYSGDSTRQPTNGSWGWSGLYQKMVTSPVKVPSGGYWRDGVPRIRDGGATLGSNQNAWIMGDVTLTPVKGLEIKGTYNYNYVNSSLLSQTKDILYQTTYGSYMPSNIVPVVRKSTDQVQFINYNFYGSYEKELVGHYFKAMVGYQQEYKRFERLHATNNYVFSPALPSLTLTYGTAQTATDNIYAWATAGTFARFNYNYREKYLFEVNGRYDGASLFPADRRFQFLPSVSVGYNLAKEAYWDNLYHAISTMKVRASYGMLGDVTSLINGGSYYLYQPALSTMAPQNTNWLFATGRQPAVGAGGLVSSDVTWAKPSMLDIGVDIGALQERLQLTFDWYKRTTKDLYGPAQQYPGVLGVNPPQRNNASVETRGFDLTTSWSDEVGALHYNARFTLSNYKGKVLNYPNPTRSINTWYDGQEMGEIWGYQTVGLFQSDEEVSAAPSQSVISSNWYPGDVRYADINGDGAINFGNNTLENPGDKKVIGNETPQFMYGFMLSLDYKGFDLQAFLQGVGKRDFSPGGNFFFWGIPSGGSEWGSQVLVPNLDRWTPETPDGYFPKYYMSNLNGKNQQTQTRYLLNAAYMRLKNLQIGYTLPTATTSRAHISRLRIYASIENLFTISKDLDKRFQVDPELLISNGNIYPISRTFALGINLDIQ